MKKLLFVLVFTFIGKQGFSQIYLVTLTQTHSSHPSGCDYSNTNELCLTKTEPNGTQTYSCISQNTNITSSPLSLLNQELNSIISLGYKLIETNNGASDNNGTMDYNQINPGTTWYFAIP
jgi:hypothetical protein